MCVIPSTDLNKQNKKLENEQRGIRWRRRYGEIDVLNARVDLIVEKYVKEGAQSVNSVNTKGTSPEILHIVRTRSKVYKSRFIYLPPFIALSCSLTLLFFLFTHPLSCLASMITTFLYYDFFSGVLHIVLDEPTFIGLPILGEPCLEFQWHHHLPDDLTQKSFLEVCGDLNLVELPLFLNIFLSK